MFDIFIKWNDDDNVFDVTLGLIVNNFSADERHEIAGARVDNIVVMKEDLKRFEIVG